MPKSATPPTKLSLSEALEQAFPCGGCEKYLGNGQHLQICSVNYRRRAREMLVLMGLDGER